MAESSVSVVSNNVNIHKQLSDVQSTETLEENTGLKVMELKPIYLDDYRGEEKPETLQNVLSYLQETEPNASQTDILVGLIYILMLETGFQPTDAMEDPQEDCDFHISVALRHSKQLPIGWKQDGFYELPFILLDFETNVCTIVCCSSDMDLLVNCVVKGQENGLFSTYLDPLMYFSSSTNDLTNLNLQNIHDLSTKVKEAICHSAKQFILQTHNIRFSCLEALPPEVILLLMKYLETKDFVRLTMTCKHFKQFLEISSIWKERLLKDFKYIVSDWNKDTDCKGLISIYKQLVVKKKNSIHFNCKQYRLINRGLYSASFGNLR